MSSQIRTFIRDPKNPKRIILNPAKPYLTPFELRIDDPNQILVIPANGTVGPFPMTAQLDGPIEVFYVKVVVFDANDAPLTTYDIDWFLQHPGKRRNYMNRQLPLIACAGDGGRPYVLPETIFIPAKQSINVQFFNNDNAERRVELVMGGIKYYPMAAPEAVGQEMWGYIARRERTYAYWQTTDLVLSIPAPINTVRNSLVTMPDDADLEIFKLTAFSTGAFRTSLRDGQTSRALTTTRIHSSLLFGGHITTTPLGIGGSGGIFPYRWPTTLLMRRSSKMEIETENLTGNTNDIDLIFGGRKVTYAA